MSPLALVSAGIAIRRTVSSPRGSSTVGSCGDKNHSPESRLRDSLARTVGLRKARWCEATPQPRSRADPLGLRRPDDVKRARARQQGKNSLLYIREFNREFLSESAAPCEIPSRQHC